jgi:hypothetical protein
MEGGIYGPMDGIQRVIEQMSHMRFPRVEIIKKLRQQNNQFPSISRTFRIKSFRPLYFNARRGIGSADVTDSMFRNAFEILVRELRVEDSNDGILCPDREGLPMSLL